MSSTPGASSDPYPEHSKQREFLAQANTITRFLEWASEEHGFDFGRVITTRVAVFEGTEDVTTVQVASRTEITDLLAKHFGGIDLKAIGAEKEQMHLDMAALSQPKGV